MTRLLPAICCLLLLSACNTTPPRVNAYDGLLPPGYQIKDSSEPMRTETLKTKTVVLVTSTNFNSYTTAWQDYYEKGGDEKHKSTMRGAAAVMALLSPLSNITSGINSGLEAGESANQGFRQAGDPRRIVDRVYATLRPYFKAVKAAPDFASAQDMKADYIVLIDFYGNFDTLGSWYSTIGAVYMFDGALKRMFQVETTAKTERIDPGLFSAPSATTQSTVDALAKGIDVTTKQMVAGVVAKLGPAPR